MDAQAAMRTLTAARAAQGVLLQADRLADAWQTWEGCLLEARVSDPLNEDFYTEAYLLLLIAHQFGQSVTRTVSLSPAWIVGFDLEDLRMVRNLWEHRDEKIQIGVGRWREKQCRQEWLDKTYPGGWLQVYSVSSGPSGMSIGKVVNVEQLKSVATNVMSMVRGQFV